VQDLQRVSSSGGRSSGGEACSRRARLPALPVLEDELP